MSSPSTHYPTCILLYSSSFYTLPQLVIEIYIIYKGGSERGLLTVGALEGWKDGGWSKAKYKARLFRDPKVRKTFHIFQLYDFARFAAGGWLEVCGDVVHAFE